jgi:hypothetical protein
VVAKIGEQWKEVDDTNNVCLSMHGDQK